MDKPNILNGIVRDKIPYNAQFEIDALKIELEDLQKRLANIETIMMIVTNKLGMWDDKKD